MHKSIRSCTRGHSSSSAGAAFSKSTKIKLSTASSAITALVDAVEYLLAALTYYLLAAEQGQLVKDSTMLQDSKFAILLETNRRKSHSKRTCYAGIRHFQTKK